MSGIAGLAGTLFGIGLQGGRQRAQNQENRDLMGIQYRNQQRLNNQGHNLQMQMWKNTNYGAQKEEMKKAGLNPGLMYGMSGGGGTTTGSQSGGSASGGSASAPMDIGQAGQMGMMASQIEVNKASAKKMEAEADNLRGGEGTQGETSINKGKSEIELMRLEGFLKEARTNESIEGANLKSAQTTTENESRKSKVENLEKDLIVKAINIASQESGIEMNEARINAIWHEIRQKWVGAGMKGLSGIVRTAITKGK